MSTTQLTRSDPPQVFYHFSTVTEEVARVYKYVVELMAYSSITSTLSCKKIYKALKLVQKFQTCSDFCESGIQKWSISSRYVSNKRGESSQRHLYHSSVSPFRLHTCWSLILNSALNNWHLSQLFKNLLNAIYSISSPIERCSASLDSLLWLNY